MVNICLFCKGNYTRDLGDLCNSCYGLLSVTQLTYCTRCDQIYDQYFFNKVINITGGYSCKRCVGEGRISYGG